MAGTVCVVLDVALTASSITNTHPTVVVAVEYRAREYGLLNSRQPCKIKEV